MKVTAQYFAGCPSWQLTAELVRRVLHTAGQPQSALTLPVAQTAKGADRVGLRGSPTLLIDAPDAFADPIGPIGLACRVFSTFDELAETSTLEQLNAALRRAQRQT